MLSRVENVNTFAGALAFDLWTNNTGSQQAIFSRSSHEPLYKVDYLYRGWLPKATHMFGCAPDPAQMAMYRTTTVYKDINSWRDFEPFLGRIKAMDIATLEDIAQEIPKCWLGSCNLMERLLGELHARQTIVFDLLSRCLSFNQEVFLNWRN
jgi:hypothetical protein